MEIRGIAISFRAQTSTPKVAIPRTAFRTKLPIIDKDAFGSSAMSSLFWNLGDLVDVDTMPPMGDRISHGAGAADSPPRAPENARDVDERVDQLLIVCAAMWELVRERTGLTENDLIGKVAEIDARDGVADGRVTAKLRNCPKCQRVIFPKHRRCLYCGRETPVASVFGTV
jgi:hypothetical protein